MGGEEQPLIGPRGAGVFRLWPTEEKWIAANVWSVQSITKPRSNPKMFAYRYPLRHFLRGFD
jgi:hypothetical protein